MAQLTGMFIGALIFIACFREIAFPQDGSRMSWVKGGLAAIPYIFIARSIGDAQNGALEMSGAIFHAGIAILITAIFFVWAKVKADSPYERKQRKLSKILAWIWVIFITSVMILKLSTGLA